jgi:beta-galactosidase
VKKKTGDDLHVMWRLPYQPGTLKAVSRKNGKDVLTAEVKTAGAPAKIELIADRKSIKADGTDLSFITARVLDKDGNIVPNADNAITFTINGEAFIAGTDNGNPISLESFKDNHRKAFHGLALAVIQSKLAAGKVTITAISPGLQSSDIQIQTGR